MDFGTFSTQSTSAAASAIRQNGIWGGAEPGGRVINPPLHDSPSFTSGYVLCLHRNGWVGIKMDSGTFAAQSNSVHFTLTLIVFRCDSTMRPQPSARMVFEVERNWAGGL
jgi:hypothetical protein